MAGYGPYSERRNGAKKRGGGEREKKEKRENTLVKEARSGKVSSMVGHNFVAKR